MHACMLIVVGIPKASTSRNDGARSEADKQLVHQSEETSLEAF